MNREARTTWLLLVGVALSVAALQLLTGSIPPYGLFHDEFYYWAGALRPGLGYVDHPPLAPWVLAGSIALFGDGHLGFGIVPALCSAGTVILTGRMAGSLGAGPFGQLLAALAVAVTPVYLVFFSFYSVNCIELLAWTGASFLLVELIRTGNERLWLGFGLIAGLALLNKHTFLLLVVALAVGVLATPMRRQLRSRTLWLGVAIALLIAAPNVYWNFANGWPSLEFYSTRGEGILDASVRLALKIQILGMNPVNLLLWVPGLVFLLFSKEARPYRPLGIAFLVLFVGILLSGQRRGDRIVGIYPIAFAAGALVWDRWQPRLRVLVRGTLVALLLGFGVLVLPPSLPLLPPAAVARYFEVIGEAPEVETGDRGASLPLYLSGRLEWERFAREVIGAWEKLPPEERDRTAILTSHWVFASVIEYYGRDGELPPVVSPHNAYYFWRAEAAGRDIVFSFDVHPDALAASFGRTREIGHFRCQYCTHIRTDRTFRLSYAPKRPLEELLLGWRHFGITSAEKLGASSGRGRYSTP
ncbi:MAG: glycosyltransferase family 39 protein [Myxococcota bacterium]